MTTPISYYGGKQRLLSKIIPLIPAHNFYVEPFIGGGAVFFGKPQSNVECINDTNRELINFYQVLQNKYVELEKRVAVTLHSRRMYADAKVIYENPHLFDEVERAWAVWALSSQSFACIIGGSWGYDKSKSTTSQKIANKRARFGEELSIRMQNVQVECADALYIIKSRDTDSTFFYCDPPYFNSDCGHYDGYSKDDFEALLKILSAIKGRFLLSSYPSDVLSRYTKENGWNQLVFEQGVSVNAKSGYQKKKWEVLTANYELK